MLLEKIVFQFSSHARKTINDNIRETREENEQIAREDDLRRRVIQATYLQFEKCKLFTA